jgi:hypothetical protein
LTTVRERAVAALTAWVEAWGDREIEFDEALVDAIAAEFDWRPIATLGEAADEEYVLARTAKGTTMYWRVDLLSESVARELGFPATEWLRVPT